MYIKQFDSCPAQAIATMQLAAAGDYKYTCERANSNLKLNYDTHGRRRLNLNTALPVLRTSYQKGMALSKPGRSKTETTHTGARNYRLRLTSLYSGVCRIPFGVKS